MGFFSRKKPQPLPPMPRYSSAQPPGQPLPPSYEPAFPHPDEQQREQRMPEFPDMLQPPTQLPPAPPFPRPDEQLQQPSAVPRPPENFSLPPVRVDQLQPFPQPPTQPLPPLQQRPEPVRVSLQNRGDEVPVREPAFLRRQAYPERQAVASEQRLPFQRLEEPRPFIPDRPLQQQQNVPLRVQLPLSPQQQAQQPQPSFNQQPATMTVEDKPLFVKIGQYREAMSHLELLKQKVKEAEAVLTKLEDLRAKEQAEITNARTMLQQVKDKLLAIDKQLFEV